MEAVEKAKSGDRLLSANFLLICFSSFAFFGSFYLLLPTLPVYVTKQLGGKESEVGLIIGLFTLSSVVLRPFVGRAIDEKGRKIFLVGGALIFFLSSLAYTFTTSVPALLLLRVFHGLGIATFTTGSAALIADISPLRRRGEAMGLYGMFANVAMGVGPAAGGLIIGNGESHSLFTMLFLVSAAVALAGVLLAGGVVEPKGQQAAVRPARGALFSKRAVFPAVVIFGLAFTYGAVNSFLIIYAQSKQVTQPALFFTVFAITLIAVRLLTGRLSDRYGRAAVIAPGLAAAGLAMVMLAVSSSLWMFLVVAVLYGIGFAAVQPTMLAFVTDRVQPHERGAAMGTYSAAFDLGIGLGSILLGLLVQATSYEFMYVGAGLICLLALAYYGLGIAGVVDKKAG